ncbi:1,2-phenylacetyl-CoA epoxidase subunit PaaD [Thalassiella azotivora]
MVTLPALDLDAVRRAVEGVPDPEVPVLTLGDLGIVRDVRLRDAQDPPVVEVDLTPTYSGCPATEVIAAAVRREVERHGARADVRTVLDPAWTTDWMSEAGRRKLAAYGIAPPTGRAPAGPVAVSLSRGRATTGLPCPRCASTDTRELSRFGSTACKALWRCSACGEPFEHFKAI